MSLIFSDPIGSPQDQPFSYQDLLNVDLEFSQSTATYFSNGSTGQQDIICINVPWQSGNQQCAPKAELWIPPVYKAVVIPPTIPPTQCVVGCESVPPVIYTITPEPHYIGFVVGLMAMILLIRRLARIKHPVKKSREDEEFEALVNSAV